MTSGSAVSELKSTNVRSNEKLAAAQLALRALGLVSPDLAARAAHALFVTPRRHARPEREQALLTAATAFEFVAGELVLRAWRWGSGAPVLLVHGWEGRGSQLAEFARPLVEAGFSAVTFDAPAHGDSPGRVAGPREFAAAMEALEFWIGPIHAIVAHSMGAVATPLALAGRMSPARVVLIAPGTTPRTATQTLADMLDLPPSVLHRTRERIARAAGRTWAELESADPFSDLTAPALIIHDRQDYDVDIADARRIQDQWRGARLVETDGLGHRRILRDPAVIQQTVAFIDEAPRPRHDPWQAILHGDFGFDVDLW